MSTYWSMISWINVISVFIYCLCDDINRSETHIGICLRSQRCTSAPERSLTTRTSSALTDRCTTDYIANHNITVMMQTLLLQNRTKTHTHTHTYPFNGHLSGTTQVSQYQKGKTNLDFTEARYSKWQWHQLGHMQVCISLQTDNHASTPPLSFLQADALPAAQPTASKH